jgi:preprotein translocase subunit SecG
MVYQLLLIPFLFVCLLLILIILMQQGKNSMGIGNLGGSTQMLFGGSGGQDIFQKITWVLATIFIGGSLLLAIMKTRQLTQARYLDRTAFPTQQEEPVAPALPEPVLPVSQLPQ